LNNVVWVFKIKRKYWVFHQLLPKHDAHSGICRADGRSIGCKSVLSFSYRLTEFYQRQNVAFSNKTKISDSNGRDGTLLPAVANTFSLVAVYRDAISDKKH
jgi:hypothetical protein